MRPGLRSVRGEKEGLSASTISVSRVPSCKGERGSDGLIGDKEERAVIARLIKRRRGLACDAGGDGRRDVSALSHPDDTWAVSTDDGGQQVAAVRVGRPPWAKSVNVLSSSPQHLCSASREHVLL